ncbi:hypothetical protein ANO11243_013230 [Dothideomycetidae sp. 11243]|nr:hypothetical protein ANO11243_013230 [fungal sp. No.11243]
MVVFDPAKDVPSLKGKTILVTGGTNGLGRETLFLLGPHSPSNLIFTGRSTAASDAILSTFRSRFPSVPISFIQCDLASLSSVKSCAQSILSSHRKLDILLAVAGIMGVPPSLTADGYEIHFGTNHLGHALLIRLLLPLMTHSPDARIVLVSSDAARTTAPPDGIHYASLRTSQADEWWLLPGLRRYGQSKLANALYARALSRHVDGNVCAVSLHPGVSHGTDMVKNLPFAERWLTYLSTSHVQKSPEETAWHGLWAATAPRADGRGEARSDDEKARLGLVEAGVFYRPIGESDTKIGLTQDDDKADELWEWTERELKQWM